MKLTPPLYGPPLKRGKRCSRLAYEHNLITRLVLRSSPAIVHRAVRTCPSLPFPFSFARADFTYGDLSLSGNLQTQQIFRHPEPDKWSIIQQRNVIRARVEYDWIKNGQAFSRFSLPGIDYAHFVGLYRGVYDSVYDFQPGSAPGRVSLSRSGRSGRQIVRPLSQSGPRPAL